MTHTTTAVGLTPTTNTNRQARCISANGTMRAQSTPVSSAPGRGRSGSSRPLSNHWRSLVRRLPAPGESIVRF